MGVVYSRFVGVSRSVITVGDGGHVLIPAGSTFSAFVPLIRGRAYTSGFVGRFALGQYHRRMTETAGRLLADHMGRGAKNQIHGKVSVLFGVGCDDTVLAGWDPVKRAGSVFGHGTDIPKVGNRLNIARVVPSEVFYPLPIEKGNHGSGPSGILEALETIFKGSLDDREDIAALESIAARAYTTLDGTQFGTGRASLGWDASRQSGHLGGLGKTTDDGIQFLDGTGDLDGGILHGDGVSLSDGECHCRHAIIIAE